MCECDPNIRTPYCKSSVCQEALKKMKDPPAGAVRVKRLGEILTVNLSGDDDIITLKLPKWSLRGSEICGIGGIVELEYFVYRR